MARTWVFAWLAPTNKLHRKEESRAPTETQSESTCLSDFLINVLLKFTKLFHCCMLFIRGGVEDTRLEAKAKDTKKIRGQSQGQPFRGQNLSRPRTGMLEAKAADEGHRCKHSQKKKGLQKFFSRDLQFIGVPRIFDWGRPKPQTTWNDVIKIFSKRKYLWDKAFVGWKIWNRCCLFACNQDFAKAEGFN